MGISAWTARSVELRGIVEKGLGGALRGCPEPIRPLCGEALGVVDAEGQAIGGGKRLRPLLCMQVCAALGGETGAALLPALAIECIHAYSLVHDDIADGDRERRGRPALWVQAGPGVALHIGDALLTVGLGLAWRAGPWTAALVHSATLAMIEGQHLDLSAEGTIAPTVRDWERLAIRKTSALFAAAIASGAAAASAAGADDAAGERYWRLGERLGLAFQARDDILGIWGDPVVTGKPVGGDLLRRKASLPVAASLDRGGADLAAAFDDPGSSVEVLLGVLDRTGARERAAEVEGGYRAEVEELLEELVPPGPGGRVLREAIDAVWERVR